MDMKERDTVIKVDNLSIGYNNVNIVKEVSLEVRQGEILGIAGESGSGKTTLLRALMGIRKDEMNISGTVRFLKKDLVSLTRKELSALYGKHISMIPQNAMLSLDPLFSISSLVHETLCAHGEKITHKESDAMASSIMTSLLFDDPKRVLQSYPFELSGGMAQRVAVLLSILKRPSLLLGDEPTSALDGTSQHHLINQLKLLKEQMDLSMILISHNLAVLAELADEIAIMYGGRIVEYGKRHEILHKPVHPYTRALLGAVPKRGGSMSDGLKGVPQAFEEKIAGCSFAERCPQKTEACTKGEILEISVSDSHSVRCIRIKEML